MRDTGQVDGDGNPVFEETAFDGAGRDTGRTCGIRRPHFVRPVDWSLYGQVSYGQQKGAAIFNNDGVLRGGPLVEPVGHRRLRLHPALRRRAARRLAATSATVAGCWATDRRPDQRHRPRHAGRWQLTRRESTGANR